MEFITIPKTIPISIENLINYVDTNFKIQLNINEDFIKNVLDEEEYSYNLYEIGKNKNNVKITKRRKNKKLQKNNNENIYIKRSKYINKEKYKNSKDCIEQNNNKLKVNNIYMKSSLEYNKKNIKQNENNMMNSSINELDIKKVYNLFLIERYNYHIISNSFLGLLDNHQNICNLFKNIKFKLDNLYDSLCKYKNENKKVIIPNIEYEILLKKISKTIPTNEFINML